MATEITVEEAQANLLRKREQAGISPSTPSTSKKLSNIEREIALVVPNECFRHKKPEPCPDCEQERQEERERDREYKAGLEAAREEALKEREQNPGKILRRMGVGERHLDCSLENYKGGEKIKAICENFLECPFDLTLSGGPGTGKTHLAVAILRYLTEGGHIDDGKDVFWYRQNDYRISTFTGMFVSVPELLADIRATYNNPDNKEKALIEKITSVDFLVLDDLGAEKSTDWSISTLYLIIDKRYRAMNPTIVTTNLTINEIGQHLNDRIASRLASGQVATIKAPDYRKRRSV